MSDTHQAAQALWAQLAVNRPGITYADRVDTIALALTQAEQRGEQRGMERAAGIVEMDCYMEPGIELPGLDGEFQIAHNRNQRELAQAIRAAKETR